MKHYEEIPTGPNTIPLYKGSALSRKQGRLASKYQSSKTEMSFVAKNALSLLSESLTLQLHTSNSAVKGLFFFHRAVRWHYTKRDTNPLEAQEIPGLFSFICPGKVAHYARNY